MADKTGERTEWCLLRDTILLGVLGIAAYRDWKEKSICLYLPVFAGIAGLLLQLFAGEYTLVDLAGGAAVGLVVVLIAACSGECVGMGDGLMLMASGIFLGFWRNLELLITALLFVGGVALFLIVVKRKKKDYRVPFIPFLLAAYLVQLG